MLNAGCTIKHKDIKNVNKSKKIIASFEKKVDKLINPLVEQGEFSGSILVTQEGKILVCKGYGYAHQEKKNPQYP